MKVCQPYELSGTEEAILLAKFPDENTVKTNKTVAEQAIENSKLPSDPETIRRQMWTIYNQHFRPTEDGEGFPGYDQKGSKDKDSEFLAWLNQKYKEFESQAWDSRVIASEPGWCSLFQTIIDDKTKDFVGRTYVFDAIANFLTNQPKGYFIIEGDPGMGKSAILAEYVRRNKCVAHFNMQQHGENRADQFLKSVCTQLIEHYQLRYPLPLNSDVMGDGVFLRKLLDEVAQKTNNEKVVIAIDALDEVDSSSYKADANILYLPRYLSEGVYFVMTRRRGVENLFFAEVPQELFKLMDYPDQSRGDIRTYIEKRVNSSEQLRQKIAERGENETDFIDKITEKSENNFMYLVYVLLDIEEDEEGLYQDLSLEMFPQGLQGYYNFHFQRMGMYENPLPEAKIKLVYILGEIRQPVSDQKLCDFSGEDAPTVLLVLKKWKQFLHKEDKDNQKRYSVYHSSFRDFLHRQDILEKTGVALPGINQLIAKDQLSKWKKRRHE
jgi:serine/threonine-protein kinase